MNDNSLKILIVEDEFISRILLKEMLSPFGVCHEASTGDEAMDTIADSYLGDEKNFDLVCLDIMLPGRSGHEVLKEMRKIERENGLRGVDAAKVVMVTTLDDSENIMEALVHGKCEGYITKPVSRVRLEEQLRYLHLIPQN